MTFTFWQVFALMVFVTVVYFVVCWLNAARPDFTEIRDFLWAIATVSGLAGVGGGVQRWRKHHEGPPPQEDIRASAAKGGH